MNAPALAAAGPHLLLVDDDAGLRAEISAYLTQHGFVVHLAKDAAGIEPALRADPIRLIILDVMMPGEDGLAACRRLREAGGPPIIIMSAMGDEIDRIVGLELGADDYLPKPCSPRELVARIRAVMRRADERQERGRSASQTYEFAGYRLDVLRRQLLSPAGETVLLTEGEFSLLTAFLDNPGRILGREELIEHAKGADADIFDRAIDVQVSRLRRKLSQGDNSDMIRTIRGAGYMFTARVRRG
ncbi:response regulator [Phenylobacterium montanum]|uniref:Regulatory protein VirG n=1 Tax=Phenylobacterium montanum TaxID=2823693 RepID=A0A975FYB7_9CAUL|nr:response regulator [Caulobacter sp. S6]QUD87219.1 response regulator [Caulobacter sp. S6]